MDLTQNLSNNLRAIRGRRSQVEFSKEIGITKSTLQAIEKQASAARLDTLELISQKLGIPASALLSEDLAQTKPDREEKVLQGLGWFVTLPEADRNMLADWIQESAEVLRRLSDALEGR